MVIIKDSNFVRQLGVCWNTRRWSTRCSNTREQIAKTSTPLHVIRVILYQRNFDCTNNTVEFIRIHKLITDNCQPIADNLSKTSYATAVDVFIDFAVFEGAN